jgi:hypothetical protein
LSPAYDPYRACAICNHVGTRVCRHPELNERPVEVVRSKLGGCGPEATRAAGEWARLV